MGSSELDAAPTGPRRRVLLTGADIPVEIVRSVGLEPETVSADRVDARSAGARAVVYSHLRDSDARAFQRAQLSRSAADPALLILDLPASTGAPALDYAMRRLRAFAERLAAIAGVPLDLERLRTEIRGTGARAAELRGPGPAAVVAGWPAAPADWPVAEAAGFDVRWVEGDAGYGDESASGDLADPWRALAERHAARVATSTRASLRARADALLEAADRLGAGVVILSRRDDDDAAAWFAAVLRARADGRVTILDRGSEQRPGAAPTPSERPRPRRLLAFSSGFSAYQREWFEGIRARVAAGDRLAVVNADAPQEILRALDIPFVVNQWWASVVAAKGATAAYGAALDRAGLPALAQAYNSRGLAEALGVGDAAPWGGLPTPSLLAAMRAEDAVGGIFEEWAACTGAELVLYDRTLESRATFPVEWWELLADHWEETLEPERLDLLTAQIRDAIPALERLGGRHLDEARLREVLDLVNEQEEWYRRTRDLIAATRPAPVSIVDTIPATMIPQWHRGTEWGRDAARAFHDEVAARVAAGEAACPEERVRLMWVGRGIWEHLWLYQAFEESHGAVFVWSMYLGLAADGYLRRMRPDQDPIRALASRFVTVGDELRMPTWAAAWHVAEARRHQVDAAVAIADAEPAVVDALRAAGIPVLQLAVDNLDLGDAASLRRPIAEFLDALPARH